MSNGMNQESGLQQAPMPQVVVEDIDQYLVDGLPVYDLNHQKVGDVRIYSTAAGYLMISTGVLQQKDLYIPFRLISSIDPYSLFVSATKATLEEQYTQPPPAHTVVETRLVAGPQGTMTSQTRQVQVLQSGYDNAPREVSAVDVGSVADKLAVGMAVYDVDGARLGDITQYDVTRGLMVVERGILKPRVVIVPFSEIDSISIDNLSVYLSMPKDTVVKEHGMAPTSG
jgi:ribosomal 30S subunit maturation factor RimM